MSSIVRPCGRCDRLRAPCSDLPVRAPSPPPRLRRSRSSHPPGNRRRSASSCAGTACRERCPDRGCRRRPCLDLLQIAVAIGRELRVAPASASRTAACTRCTRSRPPDASTASSGTPCRRSPLRRGRASSATAACRPDPSPRATRSGRQGVGLRLVVAAVLQEQHAEPGAAEPARTPAPPGTKMRRGCRPICATVDFEYC